MRHLYGTDSSEASEDCLVEPGNWIFDISLLLHCGHLIFSFSIFILFTYFQKLILVFMMSQVYSEFLIELSNLLERQGPEQVYTESNRSEGCQ